MENFQNLPESQKWDYCAKKGFLIWLILKFFLGLFGFYCHLSGETRAHILSSAFVLTLEWLLTGFDLPTKTGGAWAYTGRKATLSWNYSLISALLAGSNHKFALVFSAGDYSSGQHGSSCEWNAKCLELLCFKDEEIACFLQGRWTH